MDQLFNFLCLMSLVHYEKCPVCHSANINPLLTVKDHSVSGESFVVWQCSDCTLRFTQDAPGPDEIGPYYKSEDYISHTNTSKGLVNSMYQRIRKTTLQQKAALITSRTGKQTGSLLDVGCGTGAFLSVMKEKGWQVTGLEPDEEARKIAENTFGIRPLETQNLYFFPPEHFDAITLWHVLEHVHDLHKYMEQLKTLLKKDGKIFIAVPNYTSGDSNAYRSHWAAYDVPRHLYHFAPKSLEKLAAGHGLKITEKKPMWFDSFYISLLSSKYRFGKTKFISAGFNGLKSNLKAIINTDRCSSITYVLSKITG